MKTLIAIASLCITLACPALAQKKPQPQTGGILVEIERVGNEYHASGQAIYNLGDFLVLEIEEVATQKTHLIACYRSDADCGLYVLGDGISEHDARYLMRNTKSDYPENKALTDTVVSGIGVEMTGPIQFHDENGDWVQPPDKGRTNKFFFLKQKEMHLLFPPGHDSNRCTLEKMRLGITPVSYCKGTPVYSWVPMKEFPCAACTFTDQPQFQPRSQAQNHPQDLQSVRKAAEQGDAAAETELGGMYEQGQGVQKDYQQAFLWFTKAAAQEYAFAENALGFMYEQGQGVQKDYKQALQWYKKAAAQGYAEAEKKKQELAVAEEQEK
jgi:Sel1 repeat